MRRTAAQSQVRLPRPDSVPRVLGSGGSLMTAGRPASPGPASGRPLCVALHAQCLSLIALFYKEEPQHPEMAPREQRVDALARTEQHGLKLACDAPEPGAEEGKAPKRA